MSTMKTVSYNFGNAIGFGCVLIWLWLPHRPPTFFQLILVMNTLSKCATFSLPKQCNKSKRGTHHNWRERVWAKTLQAYLCSCIRRCVPSPQLKRYLQKNHPRCLNEAIDVLWLMNTAGQRSPECHGITERQTHLPVVFRKHIQRWVVIPATSAYNLDVHRGCSMVIGELSVVFRPYVPQSVFRRLLLFACFIRVALWVRGHSQMKMFNS